MLDTAIESYQDKLKTDPDSLVFVQLADALRKKGELSKALSVCRTGLSRHPNLPSGLLMMGRVLTAEHEHEEAVDVLTKVVQREPNNLTAHTLLSQAFMALGRFGEAITEYQKILSLNPDDADAQQALQVALERMRKGGAAPKSSPPAEVHKIPAPAQGARTGGEKFSEEEISNLLGLMGGPTQAAPKPEAPQPAASGPEPAPPRSTRKEERKAVQPATGAAGASPPLPGEDRITEILNQLAATEGMRQAFLITEKEIRASGKPPAWESAENMVTVVRQLSDVTKRASSRMNQGEVKQAFILGTEGLVMVSPTPAGILVVLAGAGVKVGLLRIALNDCLKRLTGVS